MAFADIFLPEFDQEMKTTRSLLERVPLEKGTWAPHTRSTTLAGLATHICNLAAFGVRIVNEDGVNFAKPNRATAAKAPLTRDELLATFDENAAAARAAIQTLTEDQLTTSWTLQSGDHVIFTLPRAAVLRTMLMSHVIHHRGQLSVYLRLLDVPLPSIYGPTADT
jgi:uncharacterized damage-inducible protein DinB